jgi:hypothetical protein
MNKVLRSESGRIIYKGYISMGAQAARRPNSWRRSRSSRRASGPASFTIDQAMEKLKQNLGDSRVINDCRLPSRAAALLRTSSGTGSLSAAYVRVGSTPVIENTVSRIAALGVRREKAALFQWVQIPPGDRSSRKQPEQAWRRRNV